uniref:hypothetical protein n=1 Tax=Candidatus Electrothrix sp. TaxID=2170559 RepID=UPI004056BD1B
MSNFNFYTKLIAPVMQSLCIEVMVLGMFVIGFSYIHAALVKRRIFRQAFLWRQILLLISVMLVCMYCIISYNCESVLHVSENTEGIVIPIKSFFIIMPIIDIILVGIIGGMFGCLVLDNALVERDTYQSTKEELSILLLLSSWYHTICLLWWLMWIGSEAFDVYNVWLHFYIVVIYYISYKAWQRIIHSNIYIENKEKYEWYGAAWYGLMATFVYCIRMSYYFDSVLPLFKVLDG